MNALTLIAASEIVRPLGHTPAEEIEAKLAVYALEHWSHRSVESVCIALGKGKEYADFGEETALSVMKAAMNRGLNA